METLFKGTKPLMGPKYKRQMKLAQYLMIFLLMKKIEKFLS